MILGRYQKQPVEVMDYDTDFSPFLDDGDTLVTTGTGPFTPVPLNVTFSGPDTALVLGSSFVINGTVFKQWISGGTNLATYKVTITATTNAGRVKQTEFTVKIKDD